MLVSTYSMYHILVDRRIHAKKDTKPYAQLHIYAICTYVFSEFNKENPKKRKLIQMLRAFDYV